MEFNINDKVIIRDFTSLPERLRNRGIGKLCGKQGRVVNKLFSTANNDYVYIILFDGKDEPSSVMWVQEQLSPIATDPIEYKVEVNVLENVVVVVLVEIIGDKKTEIRRSHGHIIHDGAYGIVQAASYALRRLYFNYTEEE